MRGPVTVALAALLLCGASGGCDDEGGSNGDGGPSACGDGPGVVRVGRGGSSLRELPETGGELPMVLGSQGGIHVLVGFVARDMELDMAVVYRLVDPVTGAVVGHPTTLTLRPSLFRREGDEAIRNPDLVVLDNEEPRVEDFAGRAVRLELEAISAGSHACDARGVTLAAPE